MILKSISKLFIQTEEIKEFFNLEKNKKISIEGIAPSSFSLIISSIFNHSPKQTLVVTSNSQKMQEIYLDISTFIEDEKILILPPWETLPYEFVSTSKRIERDRINSLYRLLNGEPAIFVTTIEALIRYLPDKKYLLSKGITLDSNDEYPFDDIIELLISYGYSREYRVESFGQFSVKGGIIDIFLPSYNNPLRLDFFGDTLESIREFDLQSQISYSKLESVTIYSRKELCLFKSEKDKLIKILKKTNDKGLEIPETIQSHFEEKNGEILQIKGIEDIFPLVIESNTLQSYLIKNSRIFFIESTDLAVQRDYLEKTFQDLFKKKSSNTFCLQPERLLNISAFDEAKKRAIELQVITTSHDSLKWKLKGIENFHGKIKDVREKISKKISDNWMVIICTGFEGQARRLFDLFNEFQPDNNFEKINLSNPFNILISPLKEGIEISSKKILLLTDHEIFGKSYRKKKHFKKKSSRPIQSFLDLKTGDYVVHLNHGIGIFKGIERMSASGVERDFIIIDYADDDKLYVSLDQITMVQRYLGMDGKKPRIDALGKKSAWNKIKKRVQESIEEIAKDLIEIYSKRKALKGFQFPPDTLWQEEFESKFEYEETSDQITAIEDVKDSMESLQPMDRLICGDVGFGKTEVAIRAAFKAVMAGKQVIILVPTTILAIQHFSTFKKRFIDYPIKIDMISRFRTKTEILKIHQNLSEGKTDIIIGTHALLSKKTSVKNLGLLVIDEEQKFGVKHKEQLKKMRLLVDVLTLSATPIPRTMHMSLAGIRDLSIITTPPENRQSIETFVLEDNPDITRMAIIREIERGGQIFYIHNRVQTIEVIAESLKKLIPEASFCVAHGQMREHELEEIMIEFINRKYNVLISTTIIESGLDMPNVNTIIINRADTFGLSQLYQLKGRVGRSIRKAYAYLFYPRHIPLSETAQKRLQVISEYSDLGSGFKIAMKDLEIRGSGNIIGREQSGNIMDVGFDLYCQMLDEAVRGLKGENTDEMFRTPVFLKTNFYIPEDYINDERQKIEFYKRFESCEHIEEVDQLTDELIDRFGTPPHEVKILILLEKIRAIASSLKIAEILEDSRAMKIRISGASRINEKKIISCIKNDKRISLDHAEKDVLLFKPKESTEEKTLIELKKWLQQIS